MAAPTSIDAYIDASVSDVQPALRRIREIVRAAVPDAKETLSYGMPAFRRGGVLIYFAAFKTHIGVYPPIKADAALDKALAPYRGQKGSLRFPLNAPMPYDLIERLARAATDSRPSTEA